MPKCPWCSKEYPDGQKFCPTDHSALGSPEAPSEPDSKWQPELIDLSQVNGAFSFEEGYSRPDWKVISEAIQQRITGPDDLNAAWTEAARQWVMQLQSDLGGDYRVKDSPQFILLTALDSKKSGEILVFAENTLDEICAGLKDAAWKPERGKHVILLFLEKDDYYQYVSYFYRDGTHPTSGGCLIHRGYVHIAAPYEPFGLRSMLAHELTHNCVVHLKLPLWLNEGLARMSERTVAGARGPLLDYDLKERHLAFWNPETIQEFWAGISFQKPGDSNELSYGLAEIVLNLLLEQRGDWGAFLKEAQRDDAGQTAAMDCLGADLGNVMSTFLGEGDWRPRRKAMVTLWEAEKNASNQCTAFCIFIDTVCEGRIPAWHDENRMPVVYPTFEAAQREIADDVMEKLRQFLDGQRDFEDAMTVEDYILPVDVLPDGSVLDEDGNCFGKKDW